MHILYSSGLTTPETQEGIQTFFFELYTSSLFKKILLEKMFLLHFFLIANMELCHCEPRPSKQAITIPNQTSNNGGFLDCKVKSFIQTILTFVSKVATLRRDAPISV